MSKKLFAITGFLVSLLYMAQTSVHAEVGRLPAASPYPPEREIFYEDDSMTAQDFLLICNFLGEKPDQIPSLAPECAGYLQAVLSLFHTGEIRMMMSPSQCYNTEGEIQELNFPIVKSIIKLGNDTKGEELRKQSLVAFAIKAVVKDFPCKDPKAEGNVKGGKRK